jgi:hypothetical protein
MGPEYHTAEFMKGYTKGFTDCYSGFYSCYDQGYFTGMDGPFDIQIHDRCGSSYYNGYVFGCISVPGNTRDVCESSTDR